MTNFKKRPTTKKATTEATKKATTEKATTEKATTKKATTKKATTKKATTKKAKETEIIELSDWAIYFKDFRMSQSMTQEKFGRFTSIGARAYINDIEKGRRGVTTDQIRKVEKAFKIKLL